MFTVCSKESSEEISPGSENIGTASTAYAPTPWAQRSGRRGDDPPPANRGAALFRFGRSRYGASAASLGGGRGRSSMAERQLPKLHTRVRFPSPAPSIPAPQSTLLLTSVTPG